MQINTQKFIIAKKLESQDSQKFLLTCKKEVKIFLIFYYQ